MIWNQFVLYLLLRKIQKKVLYAITTVLMKEEIIFKDIVDDS